VLLDVGIVLHCRWVYVTMECMLERRPKSEEIEDERVPLYMPFSVTQVMK